MKIDCVEKTVIESFTRYLKSVNTFYLLTRQGSYSLKKFQNYLITSSYLHGARFTMTLISKERKKGYKLNCRSET